MRNSARAASEDWAGDEGADVAVERERAARDRAEASKLRAEAARDLAEAVRERKLAGIDQLTGVSLRGIGLTQVEQEIERSRRTGKPLVLAFVDVNNLKALNDSEGHIAGDVLLRRVAEMMRTKLRPYDAIVRFGGDEFICAFPNIGLAAARLRFADIIGTLEANGVHDPISFGLAELKPDDDLEALIARADRALIEERRNSGHHAKRT
jgi:diguanylate cyclase (GGDEF)-like protein